MAKVIKKWIRYSLITIGIALAIPGCLYIIVQIPAIQTRIVRTITDNLSGKFQSEISIERVDYRFFNKLALENVLFLDRNRDTLLFTEKLSAGLRKFDRKNKIINLGRVNITRPVFSLIKDSAGQMNLNWYLDKLPSGQSDSSKKSIEFKIDRIDIGNGRFSLVDTSGKDTVRIKKKVDFSDLRLSGIDGTIEDFRISGDSTSLNIYNLSLSEKSGFQIRKMNSRLTFTKGKIIAHSAFIQTDTSELSIDKLQITPDSLSGMSNFLEDVRLDLVLNKSFLSSGDLGYFVHLPDNIEESAFLSGKFTGTIAELRGRDVIVEYREKTFLDCNFDISGLPDIENSFIYIGFNQLRTNATDFKHFKLSNKKKFPEVLLKLGNITFDGSFSGFTTDFVTYGEFTSAVGDISTDISLRPEKNNYYKMQGLMSGRNINLREITESDIAGMLNMHANLDGYASSVKKFAGKITGMIDSVEINGYKYRNIDLKGQFTEKTWNGSINITDDNIRLDLLGMFNFSNTQPEFDFSLDIANANLHKLNIDKKDSTSSLSLVLTTNFSGNSIDNINGQVNLVSSDITRYGKTIKLNGFKINSSSETGTPALNLYTDFVDATIKGNYNLKGLKHFYFAALAGIMPSMSKPIEETGPVNPNDFTFEVKFKNTDRINDFLGMGLMLAENSFIKGSVTPQTSLNIEGKAGFVSLKNIRFNNLDFLIGSTGNSLNADINTTSLSIPGETDLSNFSISLNTVPDTFRIHTDWNDGNQNSDRGTISAMGTFLKNSEGNHNPILNINIDSSSLLINNNIWTINRSSAIIDSNSVAINNIGVESRGKFYNVNGIISENSTDTIHLNFSGIDISPLNHLLTNNEEDTTGLRYNLKGILNGKAAVTGIYNDIMIESDISLDGFSILGSDYGKVYVSSEFDNIRRVVDINASNNLDGFRMFNATGYFNPADKGFDIDFITNRLPVDALNPLLRSFASGISGSTTGKLNLSGSGKDLFLTGAAKTENLKIRINYLQTSYLINDSIRFDRSGIRFNNVKFADEDGRTATITGVVNHNSFKNFTADLTINMGNNFLALNTQAKDNPTFYGKVFASGVTKIKTSPDLLSFDISARTGNNTKFYIPLSDELSVGEYSFVTFVDHAAISDSGIKTISTQSKQVGIDLKMDLTITPEAEVQLIFDEKAGDKITGIGSATPLNINLDPKGNFRITGDYNIEKGTYLFTLGNIVYKNFDLENGGRISFNGPLENADLDLKATYKKFSASLYPVTKDSKDMNVRYAVEPQILLSGRLFNPTVKFEINLPNADEQVRTSLRNAIASDEELSRQFIYLLATNSFYSDVSGTSDYSNAGTSAMAATTYEMLLSRLSNWLSQINENVNFGINYRPGSGNSTYTSDEVQIAIGTQVLDNRITINGNVDYRNTSGAAGTTQRLIGDFDAEVRITDKFRFKVFNRYNDTYEIANIKGDYTQGIGVFYREDFQKFSDLFRRKDRNAKKEDEVTLKEK
ncbi:MAG TPA: translocation/assembly module TamB domain-containing protein [Bacteroidales bacterium]|nr:translocation/assembly module TamB domain-containing protein [Bacteroidales bacterium]